MNEVTTDRKHDRIRWHARRGLLENDLILTRFLDAQLAQLDATELTLLEVSSGAAIWLSYESAMSCKAIV